MGLWEQGIHLWDSGIALSYFVVDARENHNVFESKGDVAESSRATTYMQVDVGP